MDQKISQLTALAIADQADVYPIVDTSASETKKITQQDVEDTIANSTNFVDQLVANNYFTTELAGNTNFVDELTQNSSFQSAVNNFVTTVSTSSSGGGGKPITFSLPDTITSVSNPLSGYSDSEALVYSNGTNLYTQDAIGYTQSRDVSTDWASATQVFSYVMLGSYVYALLSSGAALRVYRFNRNDLSAGGTLMTVSGATLTYGANVIMTSNGVDFFINYEAGQSANSYAIAKFTLSGSTLTYDSTVSAGSTAIQFAGAFAVDTTENYYGTNGGIIYQYDSVGTLQVTSGSTLANISRIFNWGNTLYGCDNSGQFFNKLYMQDTDISGGSSGTSIVATASEDLTAGTPVGIASVVGGIAKAQAGSYTKTITPTSADDTCRVVKIATDKVVTAYRETTSNDLKVFVSIIDTSDYNNAFTVGAVVSITANLATGAETYDVSQVDTDKFCVTYVETGALTLVKHVIATVDDTEITLGTPVTAYTAAGSVSKITSCYVSANKGFFAVAPNSGNAFGVAFTTVDTVATFGMPEDLGSNSAADILCALIATDKIALSSAGYARVITLVDKTITVGTAVQFATTYVQDYQYHDIVSHTTDGFVVRFCKIAFGVAQHCVMTVSGMTGTTITAGTVQNAGNGGGALYVVSATQILSRASGSGFTKLYTISGTTIDDDNTSKLAMPFTDCSRRKFVNIGTYGTTYSFVGTSLQYSFVGMSNSFIGFLQSTLTQGQTGAVLVRGVDSNQTGLVAGTTYLVSSGSLTAISETVTVDTLDDIQVVKAISSTEVLI